MSHIFDALQRAEGERSGVELDAFDLPIELLQIAESATKSHAVSVDEEEQAAERELPASEAKDRDENASSGEGPWYRFQSLPVSLLPFNKLVSVVEKDGLAAEKFRFLAVRLRHLQQRRAMRRLLITSTIPEEGKSMVAANLACTLASKQQKTLLLEGDLRRPTLQRQFGLGRIPGLSQYLQGAMNTDIPIYRLDALGVWILPAGTVPPNPLELMQSGALPALMEKLNACFDWIVIDSPPVLPLADTSVWARLADGILLVARQGTTDKEQLKRGLEAIEPSKLLGALLNSSANVARGNYYYRHENASGPEGPDSTK